MTDRGKPSISGTGEDEEEEEEKVLKHQLTGVIWIPPLGFDIRMTGWNVGIALCFRLIWVSCWEQNPLLISVINQNSNPLNLPPTSQSKARHSRGQAERLCFKLKPRRSDGQTRFDCDRPSVSPAWRPDEVAPRQIAPFNCAKCKFEEVQAQGSEKSADVTTMLNIHIEIAYLVAFPVYSLSRGCSDWSVCQANSSSKSLDAPRLCSLEAFNNLAKSILEITAAGR